MARQCLLAVRFAVPLFLAVSAARPADLRVDVTNLRSDEGTVHCQLYRSAKGFPKDTKKAAVVVTAQIKEDAAVCEFRDLAAGTYAVAAFHDENGNGRLDRGFMGMPKEGVAASNDAQGSWGTPSFDKAKLTVGNEETVIVLHMRYLAA